MNPTFKIAVCHHKPAPHFRNEVFEPVQGGRALARFPLDGMIGDDTGKNISKKNPTWSELTVLYWMRYNVSAQYLGLMHYRRLLKFSTTAQNSEFFLDCSDATIRSFGWTPDAVADFCTGYDVVTSPFSSIYFPGRSENITVYEMYRDWHTKGDIDKTIEIVKKKSPELYPHLLKTLAGKSFFWANLMILREDLFHCYADWLFDILFAVEEGIDITGYSSYQQRACAFISERLSNCYLDYLVAKGARHRQAGMVFGVPDYRQPAPTRTLARIEQVRKDSDTLRISDRVHVAFATDASSVPHCGTAVASLLGNIHVAQKISIHIIHEGSLLPSHQGAICSLGAKRHGAEFCFYTLDATRHALVPQDRSPLAFFRLYLHEVLEPSVTKVICFDCDVLVTDNIAKLWSIDLDGAIVGGCPDDGGLLFARRLCLPDTHPYFNAGILVLDLERLRAIAADVLYLESFVLNASRIQLGEQDILNIAFVGRTKRLPLRWNACGRLWRINDLDHLYSDEEAQEAREHPGVIHFTDARKPWTGKCSHPLREVYAMWRDMTPWAKGPAEKFGQRIYTGYCDTERTLRHLRYAVLGKKAGQGHK
jgi:lipopolysaccharide biosynthesis glycosyltransferase